MSETWDEAVERAMAGAPPGVKQAWRTLRDAVETPTHEVMTDVHRLVDERDALRHKVEELEAHLQAADNRIRELAQVDLTRIHGEAGKMDLTMRANPVLIAEMAEAVGSMLAGEGAPNYVSFMVNHPVHGPYELIAQRVRGLRPAEVATKERERADAAEKRAVGLEAQLGKAKAQATEAGATVDRMRWEARGAPMKGEPTTPEASPLDGHPFAPSEAGANLCAVCGHPADYVELASGAPLHPGMRA